MLDATDVSSVDELGIRFFLLVTMRAMLLTVLLALGCGQGLEASTSYFINYDRQYSWYEECGMFNVYFGEYRPTEDYDQSKDVIDTGSAYYSSFKQSVFRALKTLEGMFQNKASRRVNIVCAFETGSNVSSAQASPWWQDYKTSASTSYLTYGELGVEGVDADTVARVNKLEYVWKYGQDDTGSSYGFYDVLIRFKSPMAYNGSSFGSYYVGADPAGYEGGLDVETIALHELGHALGFHSGMGSVTGGESAMDLEMVSQPSSLDGGGLEWYFRGEATTSLVGENGVRIATSTSGYDPHVLSNECLMAQGDSNSGIMREFSRVELAMLQDMGWTLIDPIAVPEPSTATLSLLALAGLVARRRRRC